MHKDLICKIVLLIINKLLNHLILLNNKIFDKLGTAEQNTNERLQQRDRKKWN